MATAFTGPSAQLDFPAFRPEMAFPPLTDAMLETIRAYASEVTQPAGSPIFACGERGTDMFVVLEGGVNIYIGSEENTTETIIDLGDHQFTGEINMLNDQPTLVGARTTVPSVLLRVTRDDLRRLMRAEGEIANLILQAFIWRRIGLAWQTKVGVTLIGHEGVAETIKLQRLLRRNGYPHHVASVEAYTSSSGLAPLDADCWPAVVFSDGRVLHRPTVSKLADELGISQLPDKDIIYDVAVVGAGPAGLAAAVYASSEGLSTVVIEGIAPGGQAGTSSKIENYLGFPTGISGQRLANRAFVQALKFGVRFAISRDALTLERYGDVHKITLEDHISLCSRAVVIASGAQYRKLPLDNFERFENQGIYYAATGMETAYCRDKEVAVVGGGNSAGQAALFLAQTAAHVYIVVRGKSLAATMSQYLLSRIEQSRRITILTETEITSLEGRSHLEQVTWVNRRDGSLTTTLIQGLVVRIGAQPNTSWLKGVVALDEKGFVITGGPQGFDSTPYATNTAGIYAVGDVRTASVKRVASAVGEGSVVISDVHRYLTLQPDALTADG
ncbi:MAG TPA: FAD-dependent oxidoreductase [Bryobacteraceae bacterium]